MIQQIFATTISKYSGHASTRASSFEPPKYRNCMKMGPVRTPWAHGIDIVVGKMKAECCNVSVGCIRPTRLNDEETLLKNQHNWLKYTRHLYLLFAV